MSDLMREFRFFLKSRSGPAALAALLLFAVTSLAAGLADVAHRQAAIARIAPQQAADVGAIAEWVSKNKDAGDAAYHTFHATWNPPSDLAFAALGLGDIAPYVLRVRALGLEAQLYEGEIGNPELALPGRFDFAFVLVYLAPLFAILLFHDLFSGEREAGRLNMLRGAQGAGPRLWAPRIAVRYLALLAALVVPFLIASAWAGTVGWKIAAVAGLTAGYLAFWTLASLAVARIGRSSIANAMSLAATWLVLTLVAPALAHVGINAAVPVRQGVELALANRTAVHQAWDIPKETTMTRFVAAHPEWAGTAPVTGPFHWKWYFAFHQVGDMMVADLARQYRDGIARRSRMAEQLGYVLPTVGVQLALHRLAETDPKAQLAYQDRVRAYHGELRRFYYPYLFNERPFDKADFAKAPAFQAGR